MKTHNHVANLIKNKRANHPLKLSHDRISELLGFSTNQLISNIEEAKCHVPFKVMPKISKILGIPPGEFIEAALKDQEESLDRFFAKKIKQERLYL